MNQESGHRAFGILCRHPHDLSKTQKTSNATLRHAARDVLFPDSEHRLGFAFKKAPRGA